MPQKDEVEDKKLEVEIPVKSSMEILSELFESFDAEPPVIVKKEKSDGSSKKSKKSKKKHKHKDKKHKKKDKLKKKDKSGKMDLAEILIKQEKGNSEQKVKIEGNDISIKQEPREESKKSEDKKSDSKPKPKKEKDSKEKEKKKKKRKSEIKDEKPAKIRKIESEERELQLKINDLRNKIRGSKKKRSKSRSRTRSRTPEPRHRSRSRERRSNDRHRDYDVKRRNSRDGFWTDRDRYRSRYRRSPSHNDTNYIDKKKLLEIARKNAIQMMKSGSLPGALALGRQAQEKVIAAIKAGGKTIEELTDFCKTLSKQEELGELSSNSGSESDNDRLFNHPFQIKDRPTSITMNIRNSVPLPLKSTVERSSELRLQFPVSSGQSHRKNENEWVPVETSAPAPEPTVTISTTTATIPSKKTEEVLMVAAPPVVETPLSAVDIGAIVSQRLNALRKLQENPHNVEALTEVYKSDKQVQNWAQSKQQPGQFMGNTDAQFLSQAELSSGYQAWAKKDQLTSATPVSGGMGMHLLQKMGWKPGEGLGKEKTGALEPLLLEVKLDKKGLVTNDEHKRKKRQTIHQMSSLQSKHPVSLLGEFASKKKLGAPKYDLCFECGPDHKKNFLFKVTLNGIEYRPNVASPNKKDAKAACATVCLQHLGIMPVVEGAALGIVNPVAAV